MLCRLSVRYEGLGANAQEAFFLGYPPTTIGDPRGNASGAGRGSLHPPAGSRDLSIAGLGIGSRNGAIWSQLGPAVEALDA